MLELGDVEGLTPGPACEGLVLAGVLDFPALLDGPAITRGYPWDL